MKQGTTHLHGFTLTEVLIGMVVLSVLGWIILQLGAASTGTLNKTRKTYEKGCSTLTIAVYRDRLTRQADDWCLTTDGLTALTADGDTIGTIPIGKDHP